jgi:hypothetical protein
MEADEHYERNPPRPAAEILMRTIATIGRRGESYGPPAEHFLRTCDALNALMPDLFRREITPADWAKVMIVDKISRDAEAAKLDTCIDIAGYAACLAEVRHWEWTRCPSGSIDRGEWIEEIPR